MNTVQNPRTVPKNIKITPIPGIISINPKSPALLLRLMSIAEFDSSMKYIADPTNATVPARNSVVANINFISFSLDESMS